MKKYWNEENNVKYNWFYMPWRGQHINLLEKFEIEKSYLPFIRKTLLHCKFDCIRTELSVQGTIYWNILYKEIPLVYL